MACAGTVEKYMLAKAPAGEVATLVYENNDSARQLIRDGHNYLQKPESLEQAKQFDWPLAKVLPFQRIVDTNTMGLLNGSSHLRVDRLQLYRTPGRPYRTGSGVTGS